MGYKRVLKRRGVHCNLCGKSVFKSRNDYFMLKDPIWEKVCSCGEASPTYVLCRRCTERCLGRKLTVDDLNDAPINESLKKRWKR